MVSMLQEAGLFGQRKRLMLRNTYESLMLSELVHFSLLSSEAKTDSVSQYSVPRFSVGG